MYDLTIDGSAVVVILLLTVDIVKNEKIDMRPIIYRFDNGILMEDGIYVGVERV
jgi:hypothetical protein